jgi:hypothetical protein
VVKHRCVGVFVAIRVSTTVPTAHIYREDPTRSISIKTYSTWTRSKTKWQKEVADQ